MNCEVLVYRCFLNLAVDIGIDVGSEIGYKIIYLGLPSCVVNALKQRESDLQWDIREPLQVSDLQCITMPEKMIEALDDEAKRVREDLERFPIRDFTFNMVLLASSLSMNSDELPSQEIPLYVWDDIQLSEISWRSRYKHTDSITGSVVKFSIEGVNEDHSSR